MDGVAEQRGIKVGDGVFVPTPEEAAVIDPKERKYLRTLYEPVHIGKYEKRCSELKILYAKRGYFNPKEAPSIVSHLTRYREVMEARRENRKGRIVSFNPPWARDEAAFRAGEKILASRKCAEPPFFYTREAAYVMLAINVIQTTQLVMRYLSAVLNSSVVYFWLRHEGDMQGLNFQIDAGPLQRIPLIEATTSKQETVGTLVEVIHFACGDSRPERDAAGGFLQDVVDACVMECYFPAYMSKRNLLFLNDVGFHLDTYDSQASESQQRQFVEHLYRALNAADSPIRNRLLRLCADGADLFAVTKNEGQV